MTDDTTSPEPTEGSSDSTADRRTSPKGMPIIAWIVIIALVSFIVLRGREIPETESSGQSQIAERAFEFQCKYLVGAASFAAGTGQQLYDQVATQLNTGPVSNRIRFVILAGELVGAGEADQKLAELQEAIDKHDVELTATEETVLSTLQQLYSKSNAVSEIERAEILGTKQKTQLIEDLGWFGSLALTPSDGADAAARSALIAPAQAAMFAIFFMMVSGFLLVGAGAIGAVVFFILAFTGRLQPGYSGMSPFRGVYVEAFAVWMVLHLLFGILAGLIANESNTLFVSTIALMLTGIAVLWPVFRGVPWQQSACEIGLTRGRSGVFLEIVYGIAGYITMLPFLLLNVLVLVLVMQSMIVSNADEFSAPTMPSHPIIQWATDSGIWGNVMILFLASVIAPVLEETMFRGFLYRHLRDTTGNWRRCISVAASALFSSVLFAIIHPQGWITVPTLTTLAIGFCLLREWRGSLIPSMTAHALHNGLVTVMMLLVLNAS